MTSGKQKRRILDTRRKVQSESRQLRAQAEAKDKAMAAVVDSAAVQVNRDSLAPYNSYGEPDFVARGFYVDQTFQCARCDATETWRATQQKWWYEVAKRARLFDGPILHELPEKAARRTMGARGFA